MSTWTQETVPEGWLKRIITLQEAEIIVGRSGVVQSSAEWTARWNDLRGSLTPDQQLWFFDRPRTTFKDLCRGVAVVKDGAVVDCVLTDVEG